MIPTRPPIVTAATIIISHGHLDPQWIRELSAAEARYNRRKYFIWQKAWYYWNNVVKHCLEYNNALKTIV